jgi:NitT/TauT family transport system substrate-binding protein
MPRPTLCRLCAAILLLGVLAPAPGRAEEAAPEATTVALPTFSLAFTMAYLAEDLGFYAKHGLAVKTIELQGLAAINAVIAGSADFAQPSGASLTRAAAKGQRLLAIVEVSDRTIVEIALRKEIAEAGGFDPKAPLAQRGLLLKGRTIAVESINSIVHGYVRLIARHAGFDPEEVHIAVMHPGSMLAAFEAKQIDGIAMSPPWPQTPVIEGTAVTVASGPEGDPPEFVPLSNTVLVTRPETCEKRPTLCEKMGRAYVEVAALVQAEPQTALTALKKRFPTLDDKVLATAFEVVRKITPSPPIVTKQALENAETFNVAAGLLKPEEKLTSYDGLYTDRYVK